MANVIIKLDTNSFTLPALLIVQKKKILRVSSHDPYGIRTRVTAVKGRCLNHLTNGPIINGPKWTRTIDLTLIRRAL